MSTAILFALLVGHQTPISPEITKLGFLVGDWTSKERALRPGQPPVDFTLTGKNEWALGGTHLKIEETLEIPNVGKRYNLIVMTYDAQAKLYRAWWHTAGNPRPMVFTGGFDGSKLVLTSEPAATGAGATLRVTYDPKSATEMDAWLEAKSGDKFEVRTEAKYTKKASG
jgi:hypothetical protein